MGCYVKKYFYVSILCLLVVGGCTTPSGKPSSSPHYMDSLVLQLHLGYNDSAHYFTTIDSIYQSIAQPDNNSLWYKYYYQMRYFYFYRKNFDRALSYTDSLLQVCSQKDVQSRALYARTMLIRGDVFLGMARYNDAFDCYYQARQQIILTGDSCAFATYTTTLARISYHQQKYLDAAHYCHVTHRLTDKVLIISPLHPHR